jgi:hypothetical protein
VSEVEGATMESTLSVRVREILAYGLAPEVLAAHLVETESKLAEVKADRDRIVADRDRVAAERDRIRRVYTLLLEQHELLRRKIFTAKAERIDVTQLELEFAETKAKLDALAHQLTEDLEGPPAPPSQNAVSTTSTPTESTTTCSPPTPPGKLKARPKGRRDLRDEDIPERRIEIPDPELEGNANYERIGFEESCRYGFQRATAVRIVVARAKYKERGAAGAESRADVAAGSESLSANESTEAVSTESFADLATCIELPEAAASSAESVPADEPTEAACAELRGKIPGSVIVTAAMPKEMVEGGLLAPSMIAHVLVRKYRFGMPFFRLVEMLRADGIDIDRGMMCRYAENVGATLGATVVNAMIKDAKATAFCLSTDATGVCIQPEPVPGKRQACRKGHFFVVLADQDHVFFEFQREHTSKAVCDMFRGFGGHIQADAHAVYDAVFRGEARASVNDNAPSEVGCWAHCRRRFWEAATITKDGAAREGVLRLRVLFDLDAEWADSPPKKRHELRQKVLRPLVDDFFSWVGAHHARVKDIRGLVASAFGYAFRQQEPLRRFLDDGRLRMTNNHSERALRSPICAGRKAWLFFGSDDHATAAANLFSLIASCLLHDIDPETYLTEIIRIVPLWPKDRFLELAPKYWKATRARLNPVELEQELGPLTVPPKLAATAEQQPTPG